VSWTKVSALAHSNKPAMAVDMFFARIVYGSAILAIVLLLASIIILCWVRQSQKDAAPSQSWQGG
jgi:hypothetical protein